MRTWYSYMICVFWTFKVFFTPIRIQHPTYPVSRSDDGLSYHGGTYNSNQNQRWILLLFFHPIYYPRTALLALPPVATQIRDHIAGPPPPSPLRCAPSLLKTHSLLSRLDFIEHFLPSSTRVELLASKNSRICLAQSRCLCVSWVPMTTLYGPPQ